MTSPTILLLDSFTEYWRFSVYVSVESFCNIMLNYSYQWSSVSHFYITPATQTFPKQANKCNTKDHIMPPYSCMILIAHSRIFSSKLRDFYNHHRCYIQCKRNFSLKTRQVLHTYKTEPLQSAWRKKLSTPFFLAAALSHIFACTL